MFPASYGHSGFIGIAVVVSTAPAGFGDQDIPPEADPIGRTSCKRSPTTYILRRGFTDFCYNGHMSTENNIAIAGKLRQIAVLLDEQGVAFKPAAYRKGAQVIEELEKDVSEYGSDVATLKKLPGIGEAMASKILEYLETGTIAALDKLQKEQGGISAEIMDIEDMGPKRARQFQQELGIETVADLIKAAEAGKLRSLPRMSEDLEKKILDHAKRVGEHTKRFKRADISYEVEKLLLTIQKVEGVEKAAIAGSYRRKKETVGDIDVLTVTDKPEEVSNAIASLPFVRGVAAHGDKKLSFDMNSGLRVDVRFVADDQWGSALLYFTGSKEHNITMRKVAIAKGWKLNEYGLFDGEKIVASKTEQDIYDALEMEYKDPQDRIS